MTIDRVAITGADDFVEPTDLVELSMEFPFVEWGILLNESKEGLNPRFPSPKWIEELASYKEVNLAGHICGSWVRKLAVNLNDVVFRERPEFLEYFPRLQLNFSCYDVARNILDFLPTKNQFIFQVNSRGKKDKIELAQFGVEKLGLNLAVLCDRSGGKGILPKSWPEPVKKVYTGYAGGLGPENLDEQIGNIYDVCFEDFWIDMEFKVRTDEKFDLKKVRNVLEICKPWIITANAARIAFR